MSALTILKDTPAMALMVVRRIMVLRRSRGLWGTTVYCVQSLRELPRLANFLLNETAYDRKTGLETGRLVSITDLGIDPAKIDGAGRNAIGIAYMPSPASVPATILKELGLQYDKYSFIDLGSGMGRVVFAAAELPFRRVVGVEFSEELHQIAKRNLAKLSGTLKPAAVELLCQDAQEYTFPAGNCVLYMFNPFREPVMQAVLKNLQRWCAKGTAELYVIYYNAVLGAMLDSAPFLTRIKMTREYSIYRRAPQEIAFGSKVAGISRSPAVRDNPSDGLLQESGR